MYWAGVCTRGSSRITASLSAVFIMVFSVGFNRCQGRQNNVIMPCEAIAVRSKHVRPDCGQREPVYTHLRARCACSVFKGMFAVTPIDGQVALITGAGSGLGRALAHVLSAEGAAVAAVDRCADGLERLAEELQPRPFAWGVADVTDRPALCQTVARLEQRLGRIDILIANAGVGLKTEAVPFPAENIEQVIRINLLGVVNSLGAVLPGMVERGRGHLVGISSLASFRGLPGMAGYCASKAGLNALLDALRLELRPRGIAGHDHLSGLDPNPHDRGARRADATHRGSDRCRPPDCGARFATAGPSMPSLPRRRGGWRLLRDLPTRLSDWLLYRVVRSLTRP